MYSFKQMNPNYLLHSYKFFVEKYCNRTFEQHREMPCSVLKDAIHNDTEPKCRKCSYEKLDASNG